MSIKALALKFAGRVFGRKFFYVARSAGSALPALTASIKKSESIAPLRSGEHVVVAGLGIGALTFAESLKARGHKKVTIVGPKQHAGGKCVNEGCMPSEYVAHHRDRKTLREDLRKFVEILRANTAARFSSLGYELKDQKAASIDGKALKLESGETIPFDRLVLATGSKEPKTKPEWNASSLREFWSLPEGTGVVIVSEGRPEAASLADTGKSLGFDVTLCFTEATPLDSLPSFQFFKKEIQKRGVNVVSGQMLFRDGAFAGISAGNARIQAPCDHLFVFAKPEVNIPAVDGKELTSLDVDLFTSALHGRSDVYSIGDSGGMMSATEAELTGVLLAERLYGAGKMPAPVHAGPFTALSRLPIRFHARSSLAMVGEPWTLFETKWESAEFKSLGQTAVTGTDGKLWYLFNKRSLQIEAVHICHPDAGELIGIAASLLPFPVTDYRWMTASVHPSSAEIFKTVALDLTRRNTASLTDAAAGSGISEISLADLGGNYNDYLTETERKQAVLDSSPRVYIALTVAAKEFLGRDTSAGDTPVVVKSQDNNRYTVPALSEFSYQIDDQRQIVIARSGVRSMVLPLHF